jgi:hypothetical protein
VAAGSESLWLGEGWTNMFPLTFTLWSILYYSTGQALSPAFAEAASRRQAPGERVGHSSPQQSWGVFWYILINIDNFLSISIP